MPERELGAARARQALHAAEAELGATERLFEAFFAGSPAGMAIIDADLRYVRINRALADMNGRPMEEHPGRRVREVIPGLADTVEPILQRVLDTGQPELDLEIRCPVPHPDGETRHRMASYFAIAGEPGSARRLGAVVLDATDRKRAESALADSQERYRQLFENCLDGILLTEPGGKILAANPAASRLLGYPEEEICRLGREGLVDPTDPRLAAAIEECMATGRFRGEITFVRNDGIRLPVELSSNLFVGPGGAHRTSMFIRDITGQKQAERALRVSGQQLRELWARLEGLREQERSRISRELHDAFGHMLTSIKMDLRWMERRLEQCADHGQAAPLLDKLVTAAETVDEALASVQRIAAELRPGILDELGLLAALSHEAARFGQRTGLACRISLPDEEPALSVEEATTIFRVFQEALTNVARHAGATAVAAVFETDGGGLEDVGS